MRILVFSPYYPPHVGGLEAHAKELNDELCQKGFTVEVFTPQLPQSSDAEERAGLVAITRFPAFEIIPNYPLPKLWLPAFWQMLAAFRKTKPDIIISHTRFFITSLMALVAAKVKKVPWVHIEHGSDFVHLNSVFFRKIALFFDHTLGVMVLKSASKIVAVSHASASFIKKISGQDSLVIYRGFNSDYLKAFTQKAKPQTEGKNVVRIAYIGRLIDGKGVFDLLRAIERLKHQGVHCFIVGDGPLRGAIESFIQENSLEQLVTLTGYLPSHEAMEVVVTSDIVVNPSYTEGLPTVVIEAGLLGKAIVASDVGGTGEIVTNGVNGFLFKPADVESLVSKLEMLIGDPELRNRMGIAAKAYNEEKFNWNRGIKKFIELFNKLTAS